MVSPAIRAIRMWAFLLTLLIATGWSVGPAQAEPPDTLGIAALGDSISADAVSADSLQAGVPPPQTYLISLDHDTQLSVVRIEPRTWGYVRAYGADGHTSDIAIHRIRSIRSPDGRDWTRDVVDRGKTIGKAPIVPIQRHEITFQGHPYPQTRVFTILQIGVLGLLGHEPYTDGGKMTLDLGFMANIDEHWALGANFHLEGDESDNGVLVRGRRWLGRTMSFDVATGFLQHGSGGPPLETSWINQAHLNFGNLASFTVEMETWKLNGKDFDQNGYYVMQTGSGTSWYMGGSMNYIPGLVIFAALGILVAATWEGG
jgi:hypothetical protein